MLTKHRSHKNLWFSPNRNHTTGFTLIELMIVIAIISIILTVALPVYSNYMIRAKVSEALSLATKAKTVTSDICRVDPTIPALTNTLTGFKFEGAIYIDSIEIAGPCQAPIITIRTANTGATTDPVLTLMGHRLEPGDYSWTCISSDQVFAPATCRNE